MRCRAGSVTRTSTGRISRPCCARTVTSTRRGSGLCLTTCPMCGLRYPRERAQRRAAGRPTHPVQGSDVTQLATRPVVLIAEELSPATIDALGPDFEVRHCNGADRAELLAAIVDVDAVLVRSATQIDAEALGKARRLRVVARAGVGLDNVDVAAATQAGVMVVNAPTSNIVSAAELAVGLLIAAARNIAPANSALKDGQWKRSHYTGIELYDKTVGIVGLGRIGQLTAQRLMAFDMKVIAYDPYIPPG